MQFMTRYRLDEAVIGESTRRLVIIDGDDQLHRAGTAWLGFMQDIGRSPNTVRDYGSRVAWYLSWTQVQGADWRAVGLSHLAMWKRTVAQTPVKKTNGRESLRSEKTVGLWMTPVRSFYEWANSQGLLTTDVASKMTELKWFAPGTTAGGEHGALRRVLIEELRPSPRMQESTEPEWIDDADARERLELLDLNVRDRFLVDLVYFTGIRTGEALSLFTRDMHFGGGSPSLGCRIVDPHFHVVLDNPVENDARAKGCARVLPVGPLLVERYIDYVLERQTILGGSDRSPHVFVNLYTKGPRFGAAMTDSGMRTLIQRVGERIDFPLKGAHMLRHTLATRLIRGIGCEPQREDVVGAILGHRSASSIRVYTHDTERAKRDALASVAPRSVVLGGD